MYDSSEEEYNCCARVVGPCRNDVGHIVPDKEDLRFESNYGEDGADYNLVMKREEFRNYERPSSSCLRLHSKKFTQRHWQDYYTQNTKPRPCGKNAKDLRFWDGRIPGFITDPIKEVGAAARQATAKVYNTIDKLKYGTGGLDITDTYSQ